MSYFNVLNNNNTIPNEWNYITNKKSRNKKTNNNNENKPIVENKTVVENKTILENKKTFNFNYNTSNNFNIKDGYKYDFNSDGSSIPLNDEYTLWYHSLTDNNWDKNSFKKMCTIKNVSEYWRMINNFDKIGHKNKHLFLMKNNIYPMWEDPENRNGGALSFRVEIHNSLEIYETLCSNMILGTLSSIPNDINGISFCPKGYTVFVKIWNKDSNNDLKKLLNNDIENKYSKLSSIYRIHKPEF